MSSDQQTDRLPQVAKCVFTQRGPTEVVCSACGRVVLTRHPPSRVHAACYAGPEREARLARHHQQILKEMRQLELAKAAEAARVAPLDAQQLAQHAAHAGGKVAKRAAGQAAGSLGMMQLAASLGVAVIQQTAAGWPMRSAEQIAQILTDHCAGCERLVDNHCTACGCRVNKGKFLNKLSWGSQHCPINKW